MIEGVTSNARGQQDAGASRDTREELCAETAWCFLSPGHNSPCLEVERQELPPTDFGPEAAKRRRY